MFFGRFRSQIGSFLQAHALSKAEPAAASEPEIAPYRSAEAMLPLPNFTGRSKEITEIEAQLRSNGVLVIHGLPGMGKSSVVREYARLHAERYGAVCWIDSERESGIVEALLQFGIHYMPELQKAADRYAAAQQVLISLLPRFASPGSKPALLIFDNLENQKLAERWKPSAGAHVLITSRTHTWAGGTPFISLQAWSLEEAVAYLQLESARSDLSGPKTSIARGIAERLSCLPLALAHAAAFLKRATAMSANLYLELLDKHLANLSESNSYERSLSAAFHETIFQAEQEAPGAAAILCFASCFAPDAIPMEIFEQSPELYPESRLHLPGTATVTSDLRSVIANPQAQAFAFRILERFSLIKYTEQTKSFDIHRSVQSVGRNLLKKQLQPWLESAFKVLDATFPSVRFDNWATCERLVWHACTAFESLQQKCALPAVSSLAERCGCYLRERAAYREAESLFRRALSIDASLNGPLHPSVATHLNSLAGILFDTNRYSEAEPLYQRALAINETHYGSDHPQVAGTLNRLAGGFSVTNRLDQAESLYRRALEIEEYYSGSNHPRVAIYLNDFGWILHQTNRPAEAEEKYRRALAIFEAQHEPNHPNIARALSNLAVLLACTNRLSESETLLRRALGIDEASYGPDHPNVARDLSNLALLLFSTKQVDEAERFFRRALKIDEAAYGPEHPNVARALNNLARVLFEAQGFEESESLCRRALSILEASYGAEHPAFAAQLNNLATLLYTTNRFEDAESYALRALAINEANYEPEHPNVLATLHILAGILSATNRDEEAEALHRRAFGTHEVNSTTESSKLTAPLSPTNRGKANAELGLLLFNSTRHGEVEALYRRSFAIDEALTGSLAH